MAQGKKTPEEIERKVRELLLMDEKLTGKELKAAVEKVPAFAKANISLRTYQSMIREELPKILVIKAAAPENPWSLGALATTNEINPEAVPYIMEMQKWAAAGRMSISGEPYPPVTIRQGRWVSRLLPLYFLRFGADQRVSGFGISWLWRWSRAYSIDERLYELSGKKEPFNTATLDAALIRGDRIDIFGDTYVRFSGDVNPGDKNEPISVVTADKEILTKELKEGPMERNAHTTRELPKFKKMMAETEEKK
jgi:hypothetical protein